MSRPRQLRTRSSAHITAVALAIAATLLGAPPPAGAQSAADVVEEARARWEAQIEGVDDYTLVQEVFGVRTVSYYEKRTFDGRPTFVLVSTERDGMEGMGAGGEGNPNRDLMTGAAGMLAPGADPDGGESETSTGPARTFRLLSEHASLSGTEEFDGHEVYALVIDDPAVLSERMGMGSSSEGSFHPDVVTFYLGSDDYLFRGMRMVGTTGAGDEAAEMTMTASLQDYRKVEGMMYPFQITVTMEGMAAQLSDEERAQMEQAMEQMKDLPPEQREMMERMMKERFPQMEQMMESMATGGPMEIQTTVQELRINAGPPGGS